MNEPVRVRVPKESDPGAAGEGEEEQMFARDAKTVSLGGLQRPSAYMTAKSSVTAKREESSDRIPPKSTVICSRIDLLASLRHTGGSQHNT